ncbi:MAG: hypothetical protein HY951_07150 [Bacteroidia bacterium]|nr:hypothetical protein [Bacteroidia bacterium]
MKYLFLILFIFPLFCLSQIKNNFDSDYQNIIKFFTDQEKYSILVNYKLFRSYTSTTPFQNESGETKRNKNALYVRIGDYECIKNLKYYVISDRSVKKIVIAPYYFNSADLTKDIKIPDVKEFKSYIKNIQFSKLLDNKGKYTLTFLKGDIEKYELVFDLSTFFLSQLTLYYSNARNLEGEENGIIDKPRIEINYIMDEKPNYSDSYFTYDKFLRKSGNKYILREKYSDYECNNQLK